MEKTLKTADERAEATAFRGLNARLVGRTEESTKLYRWVLENQKTDSLARVIADIGLNPRAKTSP